MGRFENYLLNEETMTEVVHEAFFALAMLAINGKEVNRYNNIETMDDLKAFVFGDDKSFSGFAKIMKGGGDIVKAIGKFVKDDVLDSKQLERKDDALVLAKIANKILFIDNKKMKFVSASRVFSTGQKGLADAIIVTKSNVGKGRIFVSLKYDKEKNSVKVIVSDTGEGISDENLPHIFDPYFSTKPTGSGIGLANVHNIIKAHNGTIDVESRKEYGTKFIITLPNKAMAL